MDRSVFGSVGRTVPCVAMSFLPTRHGIKSNHVRNEWTGVSLARWEELYHAWRRRPPTATSTIANDNDSLSFPSLCSQSLWSMMLWDISTCKRDILDAFLSLHEACPSLHHKHYTIMPLLDHDRKNPLVQALLHDECWFGGSY
jgi:hypothetical protein